MNIVTTVQTPKPTLTDLQYAFWFEILTFLPVFDIVNLLISSKRFKGLILNSSSNYKYILESMNHVCDEKIWDHVLNFNFSIFLNILKKNLKDDLEIFLYLKFRFCSLVSSNLSVYRFFTFLFLQKNL